MAHAHHFLSRLDRVSLPHVELALGLYNDVPLLQFILLSARLPEGAPRVAISLDHPVEGPFLVVTREGRFVTCLGEGMSAGDLPVITREKLDALAAKIDNLRARIADAQRLAGPGGNVGKLFERIREAGDELSREEIAAVIGLQPLFASKLLVAHFGTGADVFDLRDVLLRQLKRSDRVKPQFQGTLRAFYNAFWSVGHLSVLVGQDGPALMGRLPAEAASLLEQASLSWGAVRHGVTSLGLKGIWSVARIGKSLLAGTKQRWRNARTLLQMVDAGMGLAALGLRHAKLQSEVEKAIFAVPQPGPGEQGILATRPQVEALLPRLALVACGRDEVREESHRMLLGMGRDVWMRQTRDLPPGAPLRFDRALDVPEDLALAHAVNVPFDLLGNTKALELMVMALPWVARAAPEQLYLPEAAIRALHVPWEPEHSLRLLRSQRDFYKHAPVRPEGPARKGPCPCGSGKKYKRCCGDDGQDEA